MHDGVANELDGDILDRGLISRRNQLQTRAFEHHVFVLLLRDVIRQRPQRAVEAAGGRGFVGAGYGPGFDNLGRELRRLDDLRTAGSHSRGLRGGVGIADGPQRLDQCELIVELVQFDRQRQEIAAAQCTAVAQVVQRILENSRCALQGRELECRRFAPDAVDLVEDFIELVTKRILFARRFFEHRGDCFHRRVGLLHEATEACPAHLQYASQNFPLSVKLAPQIFQFAGGLYPHSDVGDADQPSTRFIRNEDRIELERVMRGIERAVGIGQAHIDIAEGIRLRGVVRRSAEQASDVVSRHRQGLGRDNGCEQLLKGQISEVLAPEETGERLRHRGQYLVFAIEEEQTLRSTLQNGVGQPTADTEKFQFLALMALNGNEHRVRACQIPKTA